MSGGCTDLNLNAPVPAGTVRKHVKRIKCVIAYACLAVNILYLLYVIALVLWRLFRPTPPSPSPSSEERRTVAQDSPEAGQPRNPANQGQHHALAQVTLSLMPGEHYPTHIAQPAPLPRPREGITWPAHEV